MAGDPESGGASASAVGKNGRTPNKTDQPSFLTYDAAPSRRVRHHRKRLAGGAGAYIMSWYSTVPPRTAPASKL